MKPDITELVVFYMTTIPVGRFPVGGIPSGELYVRAIEKLGITLTQHNAILTGLGGASTRNGPLLTVTNHYVTLTPAGEKMRDSFIEILADSVSATK